MKIKKPEWWPDNPYPETIFPMNRERYPEIVPDPELRTALSGCLGRIFWNMASDAIWHRLKDAIDDGYMKELLENKEGISNMRVIGIAVSPSAFVIRLDLMSDGYQSANLSDISLGQSVKVIL